MYVWNQNVWSVGNLTTGYLWNLFLIVLSNVFACLSVNYFQHLSKAKFGEFMCLKSTFNGLFVLYILGSRQKHLDIYIAIFLLSRMLTKNCFGLHWLEIVLWTSTRPFQLSWAGLPLLWICFQSFHKDTRPATHTHIYWKLHMLSLGSQMNCAPKTPD